VKPYVCDECQKCFCTAFGLQMHQLTFLLSDFKKVNFINTSGRTLHKILQTL